MEIEASLITFKSKFNKVQTTKTIISIIIYYYSYFFLIIFIVVIIDMLLHEGVQDSPVGEAL